MELILIKFGWCVPFRFYSFVHGNKDRGLFLFLIVTFGSGLAFYTVFVSLIRFGPVNYFSNLVHKAGFVIEILRDI